MENTKVLEIIAEDDTQKKKNKRVKISASISEKIIERVKNAVYWTPGLTLAGFIEGSLLFAIDQLEAEHNGPFPQRERELISGRPIK